MQTLDCLLCGSQAPADEAPRATAARTAFWPRVLEGGWERRRTSRWTVSSLWRRERESPGALPNSSAGWWWGLKKSSWVGYLMWEKAHLSTRTAIQTHTLAPGHVCGGPSKWIGCCMERKPNYHTSQSHPLNMQKVTSIIQHAHLPNHAYAQGRNQLWTWIIYDIKSVRAEEFALREFQCFFSQFHYVTIR